MIKLNNSKMNEKFYPILYSKVLQPFLVQGTLQVFKKIGGTHTWLKIPALQVCRTVFAIKNVRKQVQVIF
jgi:hypothetical protein